MKDTQIQNTGTGAEKHATYTALLGRYKLAMKHAFYLEALLIDYAVLEDRLTAFLWAAGVLNDTEHFSLGNRRNKTALHEHLADNAALGMEYARVIDNASRILKRRTRIRKSVSMPKQK